MKQSMKVEKDTSDSQIRITQLEAENAKLVSEKQNVCHLIIKFNV